MDTWEDITTEQKAEIVSIALVGASLGALTSGLLSDKIGRKKVILMADLFFTFGSLVMAGASQIWVLVIGRFFIGLGVGIAS